MKGIGPIILTRYHLPTRLVDVAPAVRRLHCRHAVMEISALYIFGRNNLVSVPVNKAIPWHRLSSYFLIDCHLSHSFRENQYRVIKKRCDFIPLQIPEAHFTPIRYPDTSLRNLINRIFRSSELLLSVSVNQSSLSVFIFYP